MATFRSSKRRQRDPGPDSEYRKGFVRGAWLGGAGVLLGLGGMLSVAMAYGLGGAPRQAPRTSKAPAIAQAPVAGAIPAAQAPAAAPAAVPPAAAPVAMPAPAVLRPAVAVPKALRAPATVAAAAAATTTATCPDSVTTAALTAFIAHLDAAHFQRSPLQQLGDILSTDQYVKTHTVLAQNMAQPLLDALPGMLDTATLSFFQHLDVAHFQRSPVQQLGDILSTDQYVKTHTVLAQNMLQGLFDAISGACSAPGASPPATTPAPAPAPTGAPVSVKIAQLAFSPASVNVPVGGTVIWTNSDPVGHTVTSMGRGPLGSATVNAGGTYSYTFTTAGTYMYYCAVHPDMMGTVVVSG
jgi:plastocyanin